MTFTLQNFPVQRYKTFLFSIKNIDANFILSLYGALKAKWFNYRKFEPWINFYTLLKKKSEI